MLLALAHQSSVKYLDLVVDEQTISARMTVAPADLTEPLGLGPDAQPSAIAAATPVAARYVRGWVRAAGCTPSAARAAPDLDGRFVAVTWTLSCPGLADDLQLDLSEFFAVDPRHEAIVRVDGADPIVIRALAPQWSIPIGAPSRPWARWLVIPALVVAGLGATVLRRRRT